VRRTASSNGRFRLITCGAVACVAGAGEACQQACLAAGAYPQTQLAAALSVAVRPALLAPPGEPLACAAVAAGQPVVPVAAGQTPAAQPRPCPMASQLPANPPPRSRIDGETIAERPLTSRRLFDSGLGSSGPSPCAHTPRPPVKHPGSPDESVSGERRLLRDR
jgi:hypothetical protein